MFKVMVERGFIVEDLTNLSYECKLKGLIIAKKINQTYVIGWKMCNNEHDD